MKKLPSDISELRERIKIFKQQNVAKAHYRKTETASFLQNALQILSDFVSPILVGLCLGYMLDKWFDTRVIFMLILAILGCVAGTLNVYRIAQKDTNRRK